MQSILSLRYHKHDSLGSECAVTVIYSEIVRVQNRYIYIDKTFSDGHCVYTRPVAFAFIFKNREKKLALPWPVHIVLPTMLDTWQVKIAMINGRKV